MSLYVYVESSPATAIDPSGRTIRQLQVAVNAVRRLRTQIAEARTRLTEALARVARTENDIRAVQALIDWLESQAAKLKLKKPNDMLAKCVLWVIDLSLDALYAMLNALRAQLARESAAAIAAAAAVARLEGQLADATEDARARLREVREREGSQPNQSGDYATPTDEEDPRIFREDDTGSFWEAPGAGSDAADLPNSMGFSDDAGADGPERKDGPTTSYGDTTYNDSEHDVSWTMRHWDTGQRSVVVWGSDSGGNFWERKR